MGMIFGLSHSDYGIDYRRIHKSTDFRILSTLMDAIVVEVKKQNREISMGSMKPPEYIWGNRPRKKRTEIDRLI